MVTKLIQFAIYIWLGSVTLVQAAEHRAVADFHFSDDTDNTRVQNSMLGYEHLFGNEQFLGVQMGVRNFHGEDAPVHDNDFDELRLVGRKNLSTNTYVQAMLSRLDGDDWSPLLHRLVLVSTPTHRWRIELSSEKDIIETASALARQLSVKTYSASVDYAVNEQQLVTATIYQQDISDDNQRDGVILQYRYKPDWFSHGYFKLRGKQRSADFDPVEYFSPDDFRQYHLLVGYEKRLGKEKNLRLLAEAGVGRQYINDIGESAYEYRLGVRGWIKRNNFLDTLYGCTTDGGVDNYRYCSARLVFNHLW